MVFYRKYRPQKIDDLDSSSVRDTLHAVLQKNVSHAFLFTGPKGLGKTSTARIIAKVVNCENRKKGSVEPCDDCDQCVSIKNGTNVDILEIDAASNRGIDEIRELKEKIRLAPVAAKKKVYIIDEVHMLTTEAFNALLKTLEEPPDHAMFILCTTEAHKVPVTIVSRCFQIMFKPASEEELVRSFKRIVEGEKITITDEALRYIASLSDKGFRDGVKILEELVSLSNNEEITVELIEKKYHVSSAMLYVHKLENVFVTRDTKEGLQIIKSLVDQGFQLKDFVTKVMEHLHMLILVKANVETKKKDESNLTINEIKELVYLFSNAYTEMKTAVLPQLPLELAIIEWCENKLKVKSEKLKVADEVSNYVIKDDEEVSVSSLRKQVGTIKKLKALYGAPKQSTTDKDEVVISTTTVELTKINGDGTVTKEWLELFWRNMITEMKKYNHTVAGVLRGCTIKSYSDQKLIIQTAYKFHKERLDDMKNRESLLRISKLLTGKDIEITVELKK